MNFHRSTIYLYKGQAESLPRGFSISRMVRWMITLITSSDKEWNEAIRREGEIKEFQDYIRPKLEKALGLKQTEKK